MKCENCGNRDGELFTAPSGVRLCAECCSEFISWLLDGGMVENPETWAWAHDEVTPMALVGADKMAYHRGQEDQQAEDRG